jgi:hypothetical protein
VYAAETSSITPPFHYTTWMGVVADMDISPRGGALPNECLVSVLALGRNVVAFHTCLSFILAPVQDAAWSEPPARRMRRLPGAHPSSIA